MPSYVCEVHAQRISICNGRRIAKLACVVVSNRLQLLHHVKGLGDRVVAKLQRLLVRSISTKDVNYDGALILDERIELSSSELGTR